MRRRLAPALLGTLALLFACGGAESRETPGGPEASEAVQLEHVHGLGIDPADGVLYAGTHHGLFRAEGSAIVGPLAGLRQDFMGFTVAGPNRFLASGHPPPGGSPSALGLLESTDAGRTWKVRSLAGEADFHALTYRHGTAYGVNSVTGELMISTDLETWQRHTTAPLFDVAVSPEDRDVLLATSPAGLVISRDGGRSFSALKGAPPLLLVEWLEDGSMVGLTPDGTIQIRPPGALAFRRGAALAAQPEALYAVNLQAVYAAAGGRLWVSRDGARSFEPL